MEWPNFTLVVKEQALVEKDTNLIKDTEVTALEQV